QPESWSDIVGIVTYEKAHQSGGKAKRPAAFSSRRTKRPCIIDTRLRPQCQAKSRKARSGGATGSLDFFTFGSLSSFCPLFKRIQGLWRHWLISPSCVLIREGCPKQLLYTKADRKYPQADAKVSKIARRVRELGIDDRGLSHAPHRPQPA